MAQLKKSQSPVTERLKMGYRYTPSYVRRNMMASQGANNSTFGSKEHLEIDHSNNLLTLAKQVESDEGPSGLPSKHFSDLTNILRTPGPKGPMRAVHPADQDLSLHNIS